MSQAKRRFSSRSARKATGLRSVSKALPQMRKGTMMAASRRASTSQRRE